MSIFLIDILFRNDISMLDSDDMSLAYQNNLQSAFYQEMF